MAYLLSRDLVLILAPRIRTVELPPIPDTPEQIHRRAFEWAEEEASQRLLRGDPGARYIYSGFPTWTNWDLFTRLENAERLRNRRPLIRRLSNSVEPEDLIDIYYEWRDLRDKWEDRYWDPAWAPFMHDNGGPIHQELRDEQQTPMGNALEAARICEREKYDVPWAEDEFTRGYLWDEGYIHTDWLWIQQHIWRWCVEHENDERRAVERAPLPRFLPWMNSDSWREVRSIWHIVANKWAEKRKDLSWLEWDQREVVTDEERYLLEESFYDQGPRGSLQAFPDPTLRVGLRGNEWEEIRNSGPFLDQEELLGYVETPQLNPLRLEEDWDSEGTETV
ncbi:hypothetical protein RSOLAG1IB_06176 [Rhizoctonia solani AG-1 IB]|uniref:Uncharacterized protein n=1 Tax=Thanatephorus cucumeris (strain AG1-IB / isolate 7/3/14) TaxID=1108050 RepID=A0A0B7F6P8_THACB|nr:hypothetical protein RSOLAG1IB_06176 [Rhizoctonia solani AG-1 IB]